MTNKLEADSIALDFGTKNILCSVYIKCETGRITGLLGRNGCGKTCLMNIIYGILNSTSKSVRFNNVSVADAYKRPDLLLYLPQYNFIPGSLSIKRVFSDFSLRFDDFERIFPEYKSMYRYTLNALSGGQRRLIEVYVIIKTKTQFAMLDEPFSHLTPLHIEKVTELLQVEKQNKGFLITDHLYRQVVNIADDLYVLSNGTVHLTKNERDIERLGYARL